MQTAASGRHASSRNADAVDNVADDRLGRPKFAGLQERLTHNPVREHRYHERLDVIRHDVVRPETRARLWAAR